MFKPVCLYIKTHNKTGLKYFGKTTRTDPEKYPGSGKRWLNHIKYHGNDVVTEVLGIFNEENECRNAAIEFSLKHNIVESDNWANLEIEDGLQGGVGRTGEKNGSFGTKWITNGKDNKKIKKNETVPVGWKYGLTFPQDWGKNIGNKLRGKKHKELLGEEKAEKLSAEKRERGKKLKYWGRNSTKERGRK